MLGVDYQAAPLFLLFSSTLMPAPSARPCSARAKLAVFYMPQA